MHQHQYLYESSPLEQGDTGSLEIAEKLRYNLEGYSMIHKKHGKQ